MTRSGSGPVKFITSSGIPGEEVLESAEDEAAGAIVLLFGVVRNRGSKERSAE